MEAKKRLKETFRIFFLPIMVFILISTIVSSILFLPVYSLVDNGPGPTAWFAEIMFEWNFVIVLNLVYCLMNKSYCVAFNKACTGIGREAAPVSFVVITFIYSSAAILTFGALSRMLSMPYWAAITASAVVMAIGYWTWKGWVGRFGG